MTKILGHKQSGIGKIASEHEEQKTFCKYLDARKIKYFAIPNANAMSFKDRNVAMRVATKLKAEGVKRGIPDMAILLPNKILFVEMKRRQGGTVSKEQKQWIEYLNTLCYAEATVCKGAIEAIKAIEETL